MKKVTILVAIILVISLPLTAVAAPRAFGIMPTLNFNGTTATCEVDVTGNNIFEYLQVEMKLMRGSYCVASWSQNGYGQVYMSESASVTKGYTYELVVTVTANNVVKTPVSVKGTC